MCAANFRQNFCLVFNFARAPTSHKDNKARSEQLKQSRRGNRKFAYVQNARTQLHVP